MATLWIRDTLPFATIAAAARFVPLPFMDDIIKGTAIRGALGRLLSTKDSDIPTSHLKPLYSTGSWFGALLRFPLKILLYPIRKIVKIISAARGVPKDFMEVFLLMRCVDKAVDRGLFDVDGKKKRRKRAKLVRKAFDEAFDGTDLSLLSAVLGEVLEQSKSLGGIAAKAASDLVDRGDESDEDRKEADSTLDEMAREISEGEGEKVADDVEEMLHRSDVEAVLVLFDQRFTAELDERL